VNKYHLIFIGVLLVGCGENGYFRDRSHDYIKAQDDKHLVIPAELENTTADTNNLFPIPSDVADFKENKAQFISRPHSANQQEDLQEFIMQQGADGAWLLVLREPAQIWVTTYNLLTNLGFNLLDRDSNQVGELNTNLLSVNKVNSALIKNNYNALGVDNSAMISLKVKINRGIKPNSSEIYIYAHTKKDHKLTINHQAESELLQVLQNTLQNQNNAEVSLLASQYFTGYNLPTLDKDDKGVSYLSFNTDFDRTWAYLERAISNTKIKIEDINRSDGIFYLEVSEQLPKPNFLVRWFTSKKAVNGKLHIISDSNKQIVKIHDTSNEVAQSVLEAIHQQLSN